jgi:glutamine amidotransferase-like uncharacterized protein
MLNLGPLVLCMLLPAAPPPAKRAPGAEAITPAGRKLARTLDRMDVEHLWQRGKYVHWETGQASDKPLRGAGRATHCSAFAAAACARLGVYLLRPPEHPQILLANAQANWLRENGKKHDWEPVKSAVEAQRLANEGWLVVAVYKETRTRKRHGKVVARPGHIAVIRPSTRSKASIERDGPQIIQSGATNANSITLKEGFRHHPNAWGTHKEVRFYAHKVTWKIRVALYVDRGVGKKTGPPALKKEIHETADIEVTVVHARDVEEGKLASFDVLLMPGGSASREARGLEKKGRRAIREFVRAGGGYVGICAGAYLASSSYPWSLHLVPATVADPRHWKRAPHGPVKVEMEITRAGRKILGEKKARVRVKYQNGPILLPDRGAEEKGLRILARFRTDLTGRGGKKGLMRGAPASLAMRYGKGRVVTMSPHPEQTPGLAGLVLHAIRWAAGRGE